MPKINEPYFKLPSPQTARGITFKADKDQGRQLVNVAQPCGG
jgi:hypothetical protein